MEKGLIHIYCGDGKGKTTASLGLSLRAAGFGLRVLFQGLDKGAYLALVEELAARHQVGLPTEELHRQAIAWERLHGGQTPRSALQFVRSLV